MFGLFKSKKEKEPAASLPQRLAAVSQSETGLVRPNNEDHLYVSLPRRVFCVADGMGGGAEGERASEIVCAAVRQMMAACGESFDARVAAACQAIEEANDYIFAYAHERGYARMGSTAVVLVFDVADLRRVAVIHVGDSRLYRIRGGLAEALTRDHSVGFALGDVAGARAEQFRDRANPLAHVLTRAIGSDESVRCTVTETDARVGDRFVLCTDGVHDVISNARLAIFAGGGTLDAARERLSAEVVKCGAPDNYSFVLVSVGGEGNRT